MQYKDAMGQVVPPISYKKKAALLLLQLSLVCRTRSLRVACCMHAHVHPPKTRGLLPLCTSHMG